MSQIIAIANQKGGTGKSTTAVHLVYYLAIKKGYNTLLIDADSQTSSSQWINNLEKPIPFKVIHEKDKLFHEIPKLAKQHDYIVVDGPAGRLDDETKAILSWADIVLVPIQPKVLDLSSTLKAVLLINQAQEIREGLPKGALFLNRAKQGTRLKDEATRFLKTIPGVTSLKTIIHDREVIADVPGQNLTVWTMTGRPAAEARREYTQLFNETNVRVSHEQEDPSTSNPNVRVKTESQVVQAIFDSLGLMTWESFVKNRLPLLNLPDDILETLRRGEIAYTKATAIARVKNELQRQSLLKKVVNEHLSLAQIREQINKLNEREAVTPSSQEAPLKNRIDKAYQAIKKTKIWDDPQKQKRLEKLVSAIEALINESN